DFLVIPEVVVAQLGMPVEPEPAPHQAVEAAHEEVGEEEGSRLVLGAIHLVAVRTRETGVAVEIGAAVRVRDHDVLACRRLVDRRPDALRPVVQLGRHGADIDVPAAAGGDLPDMERERAAADDDPRHPGKESWSMNRSLKSSRPESSTYST